MSENKPKLARSVKCKTCQKELKVAHLKRHSLIHTGAKPFVCFLCDSSFNQKEMLKVHVLIHTKEKPHQCEKCDTSFNQRSNLKRHIIQKHSTRAEEKIFKCSHPCNKTFRKLHYLQAHGRYCRQELKSENRAHEEMKRD
jgi:KRAB domain-containing zinc finger protein